MWVGRREGHHRLDVDIICEQFKNLCVICLYLSTIWVPMLQQFLIKFWYSFTNFIKSSPLSGRTKRTSASVVEMRNLKFKSPLTLNKTIVTTFKRKPIE